MNVLPCGRRAWLIEMTADDVDLRDRAAVRGLRQAWVEALRGEGAAAGMVDVVPAARTVLVVFEDENAAQSFLARFPPSGMGDAAGRPAPSALGTHSADEATPLVVPVTYDGDDLTEVARQLGVDADEVVRRHQRAQWVVEFAGFAPGFGYLTQDGECVDLTVTRREVPRPRIPRGAVALADDFAGVYPSASPGGWQIIGRTALEMFDARRDPSALLTPGRRVRFVDAASAEGRAATHGQREAIRSGGLNDDDNDERAGLAAGALVVEGVGAQALIEDLGRPGVMSVGLTTSGACDRAAMKLGNRIVGNDEGAAGVEVLFGGLRVRALRRVVVAVAGAPVSLRVTPPSGRSRAGELATPLVLEAGDLLTFGAPVAGLRSYVAVAGGLDVELVEGSASSDPTAGVGPAPLEPGTVLQARRPSRGTPAVLAENRAPATTLPPGPLVLNATWGPRDGWFTDEARRVVATATYFVTSDADRVGIRFDGPLLTRKNDGELPSEPIVRGAIQVPSSGVPLMFFADHPTTGGYPVIAVVDDADTDLLAQARPGQEVRFAVRHR